MLHNRDQWAKILSICTWLTLNHSPQQVLPASLTPNSETFCILPSLKCLTWALTKDGMSHSLWMHNRCHNRSNHSLDQTPSHLCLPFSIFREHQSTFHSKTLLQLVNLLRTNPEGLNHMLLSDHHHTAMLIWDQCSDQTHWEGWKRSLNIFRVSSTVFMEEEIRHKHRPRGEAGQVVPKCNHREEGAEAPEGEAEDEVRGFF